MPVYDQGYRRYEARQPLRKARFWPITREALRLVLSKRAFLGLLAAAFIPFVVRVVQIYIVTRTPQAERMFPIDGRMFGDFLPSRSASRSCCRSSAPPAWSRTTCARARSSRTCRARSRGATT